MPRIPDALRPALGDLAEALKAPDDDAARHARALGNAFHTAAAHVDEVGAPQTDSALLRRLGLTFGHVGDGLAAVDDVGCGDGPKSLGAQAGLAEALVGLGETLHRAAASLSPDVGDREHAGAVRDIRDRLGDRAIDCRATGYDLGHFAGGGDGDADTVDPEAAAAAVRCAEDLVAPVSLVLADAFVLLLAIGDVFCSRDCTPCTAVIAGPAAPPGGGLSVSNNGTGFWDATQLVDWTTCCCDMCFLIGTDYHSVAKQTSVTWSTRIRWTRPKGAALRAARAVSAAKVAAAPPPAPLCP